MCLLHSGTCRAVRTSRGSGTPGGGAGASSGTPARRARVVSTPGTTRIRARMARNHIYVQWYWNVENCIYNAVMISNYLEHINCKLRCYMNYMNTYRTTRESDRQTDRRTDRQTDRQTNIECYMYGCVGEQWQVINFHLGWVGCRIYIHIYREREIYWVTVPRLQSSKFIIQYYLCM